MATLTTEQLIAELRALDEVAAGGDGARWAEHRALRTVSREEALEMVPYDRVWFYQQCTEEGSFQASVEQPGVFPRDEDDRREECRELFGVELNTEPLSSREYVADMERAGVPLVSVVGGEDPWTPASLEVPPEDARIDQQERWSEYQTSYGRYFYVPGGFHVPEGAGRAAGASLAKCASVEVRGARPSIPTPPPPR